jgi:tripartite-type tricarboxylate transporter receptor subunit TctC
MKRLSVLLLAGLAAGFAATPLARAQDYPTRQITLIAPWPAGGAVDALCRAVATPLSERLGKSVVVENRPGAGSVIGTTAGAKAAPDGYTMVMAGSGSLAISATMYKKLPYDPVKDFIPLTLGGKIPFVLVVTPLLPVHSVAELVAYAKANPGKLSFGSGGARLAASSLRRAPQEHDRHRDDARALQGQRAGADRRDRRPCAAVVL